MDDNDSQSTREELTRDELRAGGHERRGLAQGAKADVLNDTLAKMDAGMANLTDEFVFGHIWGRPGLSHEERMLIAIGALVATDHTAMLRNYLHGAIQSGIDPVKVHEAIVMMTVYGGFPAAIGGLMEWRSVIQSARKQGIEVDIAVE
jgi:4-carboxymuconolactone decarboxylase